MALTIDLTGRRALVTGGGRGIGGAISRTLATAGASVVVNYHQRGADAELLVEQLSSQSAGDAFAVEADVSDEAAVLAMMAEIRGRFGGLDILVNNAGTESVAAVTDLTAAEWDRVQDTNLRGAFLCAREAVRLMPDSGGVIINDSSIHDAIPRLGLAHYSTSKAGLSMLTKSLALELADRGIRVVGVAPGPIETEMNAAEIDRIGRDRFDEWVPLGRLGTADDVAIMVAFLASDMATYVTGTTVTIDGGYGLNLVRYDPR